MDKRDIKSMNLAELSASFRELGQPAFRAKQVFGWLHDKMAVTFDEMSNLPLEFRAQCHENYYIDTINVKKRLVSSLDGTVKYLYELGDGNTVEAVVMAYRHGTSLCVSTQVGCRMGCAFCASTLGGLVRNLTAGEILEEVYAARRELLPKGGDVSSIVLMGIGEPLDNYDNVVRFLELLSAAEGFGLSLRHVSLSTCGLVDKIDDLAKLRLGLTLSVSLHAPNDRIRSAAMPVNNKWNMDSLLSACGRYFEATGRRVSFEYALIDGTNDSDENARELAARLRAPDCRGMRCHVNLIPVNAVEGKAHSPSGRARVERFAALLEERGITATVRRRLGADINAACGQLRRASGP